MSPLTIDRFPEYFAAVNEGRPPYAWQHALAAMAIDGAWPAAIDLPTGSGKTTCIDIAVFALACQASRPVAERRAPRRIFFCVNRRIIVDDAHRRSQALARRLAEAEDSGKGVLFEVARALRAIASGQPDGQTHDRRLADASPPLDVLELRGGIHRDNRWARSATQPTIVCSTIDQVGSRLLFRGYGVSTAAAPVQAALLAYDSLLLLDEAHISRPFLDTLEGVRRLVSNAAGPDEEGPALLPGLRPLIVVPLTATPSRRGEGAASFTLGPADRAALAGRLSAHKPATLREVRDVAKDAAATALEALSGAPASVGVIVNRVATARRIHAELSQALATRAAHAPALELVIGSMRPIDRDAQAERLRALVGPGRPARTATPCVVVATQCLEVGADFDFDVLITECASIDALRQRVGRLNRGGRPIEARAHVLADRAACRPEEKLRDDRPLDPIYGNAAARTWNWLGSIATDDVVDLGIDALAKALATVEDPTPMLAPSAQLRAPVLLPAFVDLWCQTSPQPNPDPDVAIFLHGSRQDRADVMVCWRADLSSDAPTSRQEAGDAALGDEALGVVSLLPPTSAECMSVPIDRLRRWLAEEEVDEDAQGDGDLLGSDGRAAEAEARPSGGRGRAVLGSTTVRTDRRGVLWRGTRDSVFLTDTGQVRPGDTVVLPVTAGGWSVLGHIPTAPVDPGRPRSEDRATTDAGLERSTQPIASLDRAEQAFEQARASVRVRIHPTLRARWPRPAGSAIDDLFNAFKDGDRPTVAELRGLLRDAAEAMGPEDAELAGRIRTLAASRRISIERYPDDEGAVLAARRPVAGRDSTLPALDDGEAMFGDAAPGEPVSLRDHTDHVVAELARVLTLLPLEAVESPLRSAAKLHDIGKLDERFQALLRGTDRTEALMHIQAGTPALAKSGTVGLSRQTQGMARERAGLPSGFRHELLSVQLAATLPPRPLAPDDIDLVLHLIQTHHGFARPFAPIVLDADPPEVTFEGSVVSAMERREKPPHWLGSGMAERFWRVVRRFGWWRAAYLEAVLRLADQRASAQESGTTARDPAVSSNPRSTQRLEEVAS